MTRYWGWPAGAVAVLLFMIVNTASAQLMSTCVQDSPERRGEIGCSIIDSKPLPEGLNGPVFWHIDRFESIPCPVMCCSGAFDARRSSKDMDWV